MSVQIHNLKKHNRNLQHSIFECEECDKYYRVVNIHEGVSFKRIYKDKVGTFTFKDGAFGFTLEETIDILLQSLDNDIKSRESFIEECKGYKDVAISITRHRFDKIRLHLSQIPKEIVKFLKRNKNTVKLHNLKQVVFDVKGQHNPGLQHSLYECEEYENYYRIIDVILGVDWFGNIGKEQIGTFTFGDGTFAFSLDEAIRAMVVAMDDEIERHLQYIDECIAYREAALAFKINKTFYNKPNEITGDKKILCPLVNRMISPDDCFEPALAQEGALPLSYVPPEFLIDGWQEICGNCPNHPN